MQMTMKIVLVLVRLAVGEDGKMRQINHAVVSLSEQTFTKTKDG